MSKNQEIHVIFGAGPLGKSVMRELVKNGKQVRMINRSGKADLPAGVELAAGDASDAEAAKKLAKGAAVIYQCAQPPYTKWNELFPALQASILQAAASQGAKLVIGENLYMYGEVTGKIHEELPYRAVTRKGKVRAEMAAAALEAHRDGKVRVAIGRGSDFFGPYVLDSTMGERIFLPALQGKTASAIGSLDQPHSYTYIDDFGRAMVLLGEREEALGQAWHIPNPQTITQRQFIQMIFDEVGKPAKMSGMGALMMRLGGIFIAEARESVEMMYEFEKPFIVDHSKFQRTFEFQPTPLRQAIQQTVNWYQGYMSEHRQPDGAESTPRS
jgi:nucleoside-diphosphate-sugar epimerase